jgi:hypothetical protein
VTVSCRGLRAWNTAEQEGYLGRRPMAKPSNNELQRTRPGQNGASPLNSVFDGLQEPLWSHWRRYGTHIVVFWR